MGKGLDRFYFFVFGINIDTEDFFIRVGLERFFDKGFIQAFTLHEHCSQFIPHFSGEFLGGIFGFIAYVVALLIDSQLFREPVHFRQSAAGFGKQGTRGVGIRRPWEIHKNAVINFFDLFVRNVEMRGLPAHQITVIPLYKVAGHRKRHFIRNKFFALAYAAVFLQMLVKILGKGCFFFVQGLL